MNSLFIQNTLTRQMSSVFLTFLVLLGSAAPILLVRPREAEATVPTIDYVHILKTVQQFYNDYLKWAWEMAVWAIQYVWQGWVKYFLSELWVKEFILDPFAWAFVKGVISALTKSIVTWIQGGFEGSPVWPLDKTLLYSMIADSNLRLLISDIEHIDELGDYLKDALSEDIKREFYTSFNVKMRTHEGFANGSYEKWTEDSRNCFSQNPWDCHLLAMDTPNNPVRAGFAAYGEARKRVSRQVSNVVHDLVEGSGILTIGECVEYMGPPDANGNLGCSKEEKVTIGQAISNQVNEYLTTNLASLELADELNEAITAIINALLEQLVNQGLRYMLSYDDYDYGRVIRTPLKKELS